jgi:Tfp pilus assembly protein PilO
VSQDLTSFFAAEVETLSRQSGLQFTSISPEPESYLEELDVHQSAIRCAWRGSSTELIAFLVQLHSLGAVADIRDLRIQNRNGLAESLSGSLELEFVYTRFSP